jgi:D-alanyl-D-alanine carboxypeptidase
MKKKVIFVLAVLLLTTAPVYADSDPGLLAQGVAVYGWKDGVATQLYAKQEHTVFPIASLTKLITAKAVEELYPADQIFTITKNDVATLGATPGITVGAKYSRDDLLKALLVQSSNDASVAFTNPVGLDKFLSVMNDILHTNGYTMTSFINTSGLDPDRSSGEKPNRMTPYQLSVLLHDIYSSDPLLTKIMGEGTAEISTIDSSITANLRHTNVLYSDPIYSDYIVMSKTGTTTLAKQNLAFVMNGVGNYDYFTVVLLGSTNRAADAKRVINWITATPIARFAFNTNTQQ